VENWERAIQSYERAVQTDPKFALAYAKLSSAHARFYYYWYDFSPERREKARAAVDKAVELAPNASETHVASGYYHLLVERDVPKALSEFEIAARGLPMTPISSGPRRTPSGCKVAGMKRSSTTAGERA